MAAHESPRIDEVKRIVIWRGKEKGADSEGQRLDQTSASIRACGMCAIGIRTARCFYHIGSGNTDLDMNLPAISFLNIAPGLHIFICIRGLW